MKILPNQNVLWTVCHSHCGGACPLKLHIEDGTITHIETDDGTTPQVRACLRGRAYRQRVYSDKRLLYPLKRVGPRGSGNFSRITWDEALDTIVSEIRRIINTYGPEALALMASGGDITQLHGPPLIDKLFSRLGGYSTTWGMHSAEGSYFAQMVSYGTIAAGNTRDDLINSNLIILWGWNPAITVSFDNTSHHIMKAKEAGTKVICIDPRYTATAATLADEWIPILPGTDAAALLGIAFEIITGGLEDSSFIRRHVSGYQAFSDHLMGFDDGIPKTAEWASDICGIPANKIKDLAHDYANIKPAAFLDGIAPGRTAFGEEFHRCAIALAAITGNIGISGGNSPGFASFGGFHPHISLGPPITHFIPGGINPVDLAAEPRKLGKFNGMGDSSARVNRFQFADAILKGREGGYPADYKLLYMINSNYLNQCGNTNKIAQALNKLEFIVIQEQLLTPTARYADIILPTNTFLERKDLTTGGISPFVAYTPQVIKPLGESKSHFEIACDLAKRLGINNFCSETEDDLLKKAVDQINFLPDFEELKQEGMLKIKSDSPFICFEEQINSMGENPFPTPSGRIELFSSALAEHGDPYLPASPTYFEPWEGPTEAKQGEYPLQLITSHDLRRAHTQFNDVPWLRELYMHGIKINPKDAQKRGIKDGNKVKVFNERGETVLTAQVTSRIMPGVVDIPEGGWYAPDYTGTDMGGCANVLTKDAISPGGAFPSNTALVQVEKINL